MIFITWLHNKPQGCNEYVASAAGPFTIRNIDTDARMTVNYYQRMKPVSFYGRTKDNRARTSGGHSGHRREYFWKEM
jgi:hypothetical protein